MKTTVERERRAKRVFRRFELTYCLLSVFLVIFYAVRHDSYHLSVSLGTFAFPLLLEGVWRLPFLKRVWQVDCLVLAFVFIAYPLGSCVDLFHWLPGFDKVAHMLSGMFVSLLALILYYALKPGHRVERNDKALAICFMGFASIAVAGLWEIGEYLLSGIVHRDLQCVAATGVADSMQDMIVCTIGTLAAIPVAAKLCDGKIGALSAIVYDFAAIQFARSPHGASDASSTHRRRT